MGLWLQRECVSGDLLYFQDPEWCSQETNKIKNMIVLLAANVADAAAGDPSRSKRSI